jgi:hypothetical protein
MTRLFPFSSLPAPSTVTQSRLGFEPLSLDAELHDDSATSNTMRHVVTNKGASYAVQRLASLRGAPTFGAAGRADPKRRRYSSLRAGG